MESWKQNIFKYLLVENKNQELLDLNIKIWVPGIWNQP